MTWTTFGNGLYTCLSTDTKITVGITAGSGLKQLDDGKSFYFTAGAWADVTPAGGGGGGTGDVTGAANVGTGTGTVFRDEITGVLNLKTIKAGTGIVITNNVDDITLDATGAGGGEANTASNFGTVGTGLWKDKNGVDLRFYKINPVDTKLSIALNGTDRIDIGVVEGNLTLANLAGTLGNAKISDLAWGKLTAVPTSFTPSAHRATHISGGSDTFVKTDILAAPSRYLENRADPTSDSGAIWINSTSETIEYWDTLATPVLRALVNTASAQTLTNKTLSAASNTITATSVVAGSILKANGTKYDSLARGTALQVLRVNSGATDTEWASLNSENTGKATASGTGSATVFNIAHGLGVNPANAIVVCSSLVTTFTYTTDTTNIVVTFSTAPVSGTSNVIFHWRAVA